MFSSLAELDVALRSDLMTFVHACFIELNPEQEFSEAAYLPMLASKLAESLTGQGPRRLIVCLPPRSLKSVMISVAAVAWLLGKDPSKRIICASYGQELADKHARDTKTVMSSDFYRRAFRRRRSPRARSRILKLRSRDLGWQLRSTEYLPAAVLT